MYTYSEYSARKDVHVYGLLTGFVIFLFCVYPESWMTQVYTTLIVFLEYPEMFGSVLYGISNALTIPWYVFSQLDTGNWRPFRFGQRLSFKRNFPLSFFFLPPSSEFLSLTCSTLRARAVLFAGLTPLSFCFFCVNKTHPLKSGVLLFRLFWLVLVVSHTDLRLIFLLSNHSVSLVLVHSRVNSWVIHPGTDQH